jgi:hypothetical protein
MSRVLFEHVDDNILDPDYIYIYIYCDIHNRFQETTTKQANIQAAVARQ